MKQRRGAVVIVVLVVVMMVSLAGYHFTLSMESEHLAVRHAGDQIALRHAALSGAELIAAILEQPRRDRDQWDLSADRTMDLWLRESDQPSPLQVTISPPVDESAKINLHQLLQWDLERPGSARAALVRLPELDESTADRLLDWIDSDSDQRRPDSEQQARNSVPLLVEELAFLQPQPQDGPRVNPSLPGDQSKPDQTFSRQPAWLAHLTVSSAERNESAEGRPRIFVNAADLMTLHRQLTRELSAAWADYIVLLRQYGPSRRRSSATPSPAEAATVDLAMAPTFEISSLVELLDSTVQVPSPGGSPSNTAATIVVASPLNPLARGGGVAGGGGGDSVDEVFDRLTLSQNTRLRGRISLLTAPLEVLSGVPGLDESLAERIIEIRAGASAGTATGGGNERRFRHPIGLLSSLGLDSTILSRVLPHVTCGGDVVRAQVVGSMGDPTAETAAPNPYSVYRCEVLLDASQGKTRQLLLRRQPS
jgi:DNA uptake protein ComE-like DNA-binding protein